MHPDNKIVSFVVIAASYLHFHTHFIRGVKVYTPKRRILEDRTKSHASIFFPFCDDSYPNRVLTPLQMTSKTHAAYATHTNIWCVKKYTVKTFCRHFSSLLAQIIVASKKVALSPHRKKMV